MSVKFRVCEWADSRLGHRWRILPARVRRRICGRYDVWVLKTSVPDNLGEPRKRKQQGDDSNES